MIRALKDSKCGDCFHLVVLKRCGYMYGSEGDKRPDVYACRRFFVESRHIEQVQECPDYQKEGGEDEERTEP